MNPFVIAGIIIAALLVGLVANRFVRPFATSEVQGVKLETLTGPIVSVTVLLLAFTLVTVYQSYLRGQTAAADEARKVDHQFEVGQLLPEPQRQQLTAAITCYAAAVAAYEWETMEQGRTAPEVSPWTRRVRATLSGLVARDDVASPVLSALLTADRDRGEARSRRLTEAQPAIPIELKTLLVLTASLGILVLATFTLGSVNRRVQVGVLTVLSLVFIVFLVAITDLDRPYGGWIAVPPSDIARVAGDLSGDWAEDYPAAALPCDVTGRQT